MPRLQFFSLLSLWTVSAKPQPRTLLGLKDQVFWHSRDETRDSASFLFCSGSASEWESQQCALASCFTREAQSFAEGLAKLFLHPEVCCDDSTLTIKITLWQKQEWKPTAAASWSTPESGEEHRVLTTPCQARAQCLAQGCEYLGHNQTYQAGFSYTLQWLWMSPAEFTALIKETSWISQNSGEVHKDRTQWLTVLPELPAIGLSTTSDTQAASVLNSA